MSPHRASDDSFEGSALAAAQARRDERQRKEENQLAVEQLRRDTRFADLLARVFGEYWPGMQAEAGAHGTEFRQGDLLFSLVDTPKASAPELAVSAQCPICRRTFKHHPVRGRADVGELLAQLQDHPDCADPAAREMVKRQEAEARRAARDL